MKVYNLFLLLFVFSINSYSQTFKVGAAYRNITPKQLIPISGGLGAAIMPNDKKGTLFVRAFVLEQNNTKIAIVSIDNLGWTSYLGDRSRKLIKGIAPIPS